MIAHSDHMQGFLNAPGPAGARREAVACDRLPLTGARCVLASIGDALILVDLASSDAVGQPRREPPSQA